jgi:hypothetical protein
MLLVPSVEVTKGEPQPPAARTTSQPLAIVGGLVAVMLKAERTVLPSLFARSATKVPLLA